ncbi:MAG: hypothetical protein H0U74_06550 [Bradymonadaceae bacterium]|nr:hypothetical protein [Lujinxingiaceae bacterium]
MKALRPIERYLARHATPADPCDALSAPAPGLKLCVVIPAMAEHQNIARVLDSLALGSTRLGEAEVIIVINAPDNASAAVFDDNMATLALLADRPNGALGCVVLDRASPGRAFAWREAGVGCARRVGMDLALARLHATGNAARGVIACLDGDSPVAPGHIDGLLAAFEDGDHLAGLCHYRHPIPEDQELAAAIVSYELWLRYYELCLRRARSPYAFQTIGSCTVITARGYAMADGMPRRKAGEDFYMLDKLVKVGGAGCIISLDQVLVEPSARLSDRVPFGTGAAVTHCVDVGRTRYQHVEPAALYPELARFFASLPMIFQEPAALDRQAAPTVHAYLDTLGGRETLARLRTNHTDATRFTRAFHTWFDGLRTVQYGHFGKQLIGAQWIFDALADLLSERVSDLARPEPDDAPLELQIEWLERLRNLA